MNGIEVLEAIHEHLPETIVLMVTANDDDEIVKQAIEKGAAGYIVKPFNTASVLDTLNQARESFIVRNPAQVMPLLRKPDKLCTARKTILAPCFIDHYRHSIG